MKPALIVIDVQKAFFKHPIKAQSLNDAIVSINAAIDLFRKKNLPVICVQHIDEEDQLMPGTAGFDLPEHLDILPDDIHIYKTYGNAFNKTPLLEKLRALEVDTVILSGYCAENCVLSTCRGAEDVDLTPILLRGSLASGNLERIRFVEGINEVISYGALERVLA